MKQVIVDANKTDSTEPLYSLQKKYEEIAKEVPTHIQKIF